MSDLDTLMKRYGELNTKDPTTLTSEDIKDIIAYHRHYRMKKFGLDTKIDNIDDIRKIMIDAELLPVSTEKFTIRRIESE